MPHVGTHVPPALAARFTDEGQRVPNGAGLYPDPADASNEADITDRRVTIWQPHHDQLAHELARLKAACSTRT